MVIILKESDPKESGGWKYKEVEIDFTNKSKKEVNEVKAIQIKMFD